MTDVNVAFVVPNYGPLWAPAVDSWLRLVGYTSRYFTIEQVGKLGAIGITAYLGGAVCANWNNDKPLVSTTLFAVYLGALLWVAMVLRRPALLDVVGLRRSR